MKKELLSISEIFDLTETERKPIIRKELTDEQREAARVKRAETAALASAKIDEAKRATFSLCRSLSQSGELCFFVLETKRQAYPFEFTPGTDVDEFSTFVEKVLTLRMNVRYHKLTARASDAWDLSPTSVRMFTGGKDWKKVIGMERLTGKKAVTKIREIIGLAFHALELAENTPEGMGLLQAGFRPALNEG